MQPNTIQTKIFLDSGDPAETEQALDFLGYLDGQTTNPSLIAKNPDIQKRIKSGETLTAEEVNELYHSVIVKIDALIPGKAISIEVYADSHTSAEKIIQQAHTMNRWIDRPYIKVPIIPAGLAAATQLSTESIRLNATLCFTQQQAAAVHAATLGAKQGDIFVSPFDGRLDDMHVSGLSLIENITQMYSEQHSHVQVVMASIRDVPHLQYALYRGFDIVTVPFPVLKEWAEGGAVVPAEMELTALQGDKHIVPFEELDLKKPWTTFDINHELTASGLDRFASDWQSVIGQKTPEK